MASALFYQAQARISAQSFMRGQGQRFRKQAAQRAGTVLNDSEISVGGQTYPFHASGLGVQAGQVLSVVNVGRPASAIFAPADGSGLIQMIGGGSTTSGSMAAHALNGPYHTGTLAAWQYPDALLSDGSRQITGDLSVASGVEVGELEYIADGVRVLAGLWAGRRSGAHVGLFRIPGSDSPDTFTLEATNHTGLPFLSVGALDEPGTPVWARLGYEGEPGIEMDETGQMQVDPDTFSRLLGPDDLDMAAISATGLSSTGDIAINADSDSSGAGEIKFQTKGVTRLTIDNTGTSTFTRPVVIQDTTGAGIDVSRSGGAETLKSTSYYTGATQGGRFRVQFARGTRGSEARVNSGDFLGQFESAMWTDADPGDPTGHPAAFHQSGAIVFQALGDETATPPRPAYNSYGTDLLFRLVLDNTATVTTKMILENDGTLTVGPTRKTGSTGGNVFVGKLGVGIDTTISAKIHASQASSTGAIPVMYLKQVDVDQPFINLECTVGTGNALEAVGSKTLTVTHYAMVSIQGVGNRYLPIGTIA